MTEMWPISPDPRTQNQVAGILLVREMQRIASGELTEPQRAAIADRNPSGGDVKQAPSRSDESSGGEANRTDNPVITPCNQTTP